MKFFLMRHGQAETFARTDPARALTDRGRDELRCQLKNVRPQLADVDCIIHSPYLRALQTAELVAASLAVADIYSSDVWVPDAEPSAALSTLESFAERCPLVVCHMPLIGRVTALCCEGDTRYPEAFSCGEIAVIEADWPAAGLGCLRQRLV